MDVRYFQLDAVDMPSGLKSKFLITQVLYEEANIESYKQESRVVRKETDADVCCPHLSLNNIICAAQIVLFFTLGPLKCRSSSNYFD